MEAFFIIRYPKAANSRYLGTFLGPIAQPKDIFEANL